MERFDELLKVLEEKSYEMEDSQCWDECLPEDVYNEFFKGNYKEVASGLNVDTHRWYETSTTVIEIFGRFLGITHVSNIFSENMDVSDCGESVSFKEMKQVQTVTYI